MKVFTVGQVAKICKVSPRTVIRWCDSERLKAYGIPGTQDRRISREDLIRFLKEHRMPLGDLEDDHLAKVLIFSEDNVLVEYIKTGLCPEKEFKVTSATSSFAAGILVESFHPDAIAIDFSIGAVEAGKFCRSVRNNDDCREVILIALLAEVNQMESVIRTLLNETFIKPFCSADFAGRLRILMDAKKRLS